MQGIQGIRRLHTAGTRDGEVRDGIGGRMGRLRGNGPVVRVRYLVERMGVERRHGSNRGGWWDITSSRDGLLLDLRLWVHRGYLPLLHGLRHGYRLEALKGKDRGA